MKEKAEIEIGLSHQIEQYGEWIYDIALPHGLWTRSGEHLPHTRLKRVLQIIKDVALKPLSECRILDLACLEGIYSIEFALHGADVTGIEIRNSNLQKALFVKDAYELNNVQFIRDDVRNVSLRKYGSFDIVLCSGILYHLPVPDVFEFVKHMHEITERAAIIDTHISLAPVVPIRHDGKNYYGHVAKEHDAPDAPEMKESRVIASIDNITSFQFSRPSLMNLLSHEGFSSVYECFNPPHINYGMPGLEHLDRCTFLAIKGQNCSVRTSPLTNTLQEDWPENSLSYSYKSHPANQDRLKRALSRGRSLLKKVTPNKIRSALRF